MNTLKDLIEQFSLHNTGNDPTVLSVTIRMFHFIEYRPECFFGQIEVLELNFYQHRLNLDYIF